MQAIILAAGMGRRLGECTKDNTKCMLPINGMRLIDRVLTQLSRYNLSRIIIVVGYKGQNVVDYVGNRYKNVEFYNNPIYDKTNNIYSLSLVKDKMLEEDTLLIESDLIVDDKIFELLINDPSPNLALVAKYENWMDGTMVRIDDDNNIVNFVPKEAFRYEDTPHYYKTVNIYKFSKEFSKNQYVPFLDAYVKALGNNEYYEQVLRVITLINRSELKAKPIGSLPWYEIDDIQDKNNAETIFADKDTKYAKYELRDGGLWSFESLLDFSHPGNPYFPIPKLKEEMKSLFDRLICERPSSPAIDGLLAGKFFNVSPRFTLAGSSKAAMLIKIASSIGGKVGCVASGNNTPFADADAVESVVYDLNNEGLKYTAADLELYFADKGVSAIFIASPDYVTGNMLPKDDILELTARMAKRGIMVIVDESLINYSELWLTDTLMTDDIIENYPNLIIVKSLGDGYGVPGLNATALATSNELRKKMAEDHSWQRIDSISEFFMQIFNKYEKDFKNSCAKFQAEKKRLFDDLSSLRILKPVPSDSNTWVCEVAPEIGAEALADNLLNNYSILVGTSGVTLSVGGAAIKIGVRKRADNQKLVEALKQIELASARS